MIKKQHMNQLTHGMSTGLINILFITLVCSTGYACSKGDVEKMNYKVDAYELVLDKRSGDVPEVPSRVPHQQLDHNSNSEILEKLKSFLFSMEHVKRKSSRNSFPSALGAYIDDHISMNRNISREFTHIHMEPGPGSQHLTLTEADFQLVREKGWGIKHPWSDRLSADGLVLMMIYAPRNETDLENVKKIITAAWHLALDTD